MVLSDSSNSLSLPSLQSQVRHEMDALVPSWGAFVAWGGLLIVLGLVALSVSELTTLVSIAFLGWVLALGGAVGSIHSFTYLSKGFGLFMTHLIASLLYLMAGIIALFHPGVGALTLTLVLVMALIGGGVSRIVSSLVYKPFQWGWWLASGALGTVLGFLILGQWPNSALWLIGTYLGLEMLFHGVSAVSFGFALRKLYKRSESYSRPYKSVA